jgi:hypothetical protein
MRVPATTAAGPVDALPQDLVDREFSQIMWTEFSGQVKTYRVWQGTSFRANFLKGLSDPANRVSFDLTGIDSPFAAVTRVAQAGGRLGARGTSTTDWELFQIRNSPDAWSRITWYQNGGVVDNPFG